MIDGRYRVLETLVDSETRAVYLTEHRLIGRRMVVKMLHPSAAQRPEAVTQFVSEAEAAGKLRHPNIVESIDMGFVDGQPFVAFEYLQGARLSEEIERLGRLSVRRAVHVARQLAAALGAAHLEGIVHGCLDSDDVFLVDRETDPDFVKVLGLGKLGDGPRAGTPETLSPEQIVAPEDVDHRCDVWAVGILLYEMIAGRRPFSGDAGAATARRRIVQSEAPAIDRPDVPAELLEVIYACLAKNPDERFQDMAEVDNALAVFDVALARGSRTTIPPLPLDSLPRVRRPSSPQAAMAFAAQTSTMPPRTGSWSQPLPTETLPPQPAPQASRRRLIPVAIGGAAVILAAGAIWLMVGRGTEAAPRPSRSVASAAPLVAAPLGAAGATVAPAKDDVEVSVECDTPGARVTFRRHVNPTPMSLDVPAGDQVELVEVSASGYKTERYWLTFDRPTHLHATLARGAGLVEATEQETLAALGETADDTAVPAVAIDSSRKQKDRPAPAQHRHIGRTDDAAEATPPMINATGDSTPPPPSGADAAAAEPAPAPEPAPAVAVAPIPAEVPAAAQPAAAPRSVAAGFLEANRIAGTSQILPDNGTRQALQHNGNGKIVARFKLCVAPSGEVARVSMLTSSGYAGYDDKIAGELHKWRFKPIAIGGEAAAVCAAVSIAYSQQ